VIVQNAAEERCIRRRWSRDIGRAKANALQRSRADALALELAPEILALRARRQLSRDRPGAQRIRPALGARRPLGGGDAPAAHAPSRKRRCNRSKIPPGTASRKAGLVRIERHNQGMLILTVIPDPIAVP